jgi:octaprenyl-diphosphate synthase
VKSATVLTVVEPAVAALSLREPVLGSLERVASSRGLEANAERIGELRAFLADDLADVERDLDAMERGETPMHESAQHLLAGGGKRIRPMCVALAARLGSGFGPAARDLAVAAELVHSATLLHDDVVDVGERRRGSPAARVIWGNAASIFAGDWLLVEALVRVRRAKLPDVLDRALGVLAEMLEAEALQLARRGSADVTRADYMKVVEGKTASLFRWALFAGARAGGLDDASCALVEEVGGKVGVAFQVIDDVLDVDGDPEVLGKGVLGDLAEGKMTYPLIVAIERSPELRGELSRALAGGEAAIDPATARSVARAIVEVGAAAEGRRFAEALVDEALGALRRLPDRPARRALETVARTIVSRRS